MSLEPDKPRVQPPVAAPPESPLRTTQPIHPVAPGFLPARLVARQRVRKALSAWAIILASCARAQVSQFTFDANGNLLIQTSESTGLPQIVSQPQLQVVMPGALGSFFVVAADTRGLSYQWRFNGTNINGAAGDALLLQNVGATNEGLYSVVLTNGSGSVTSAPAALYIDSDDDGLPDSWEMTYFGNLNRTATGDFDGDGTSNLNEFLDGTNPTNSASVLFRLTVLRDGGKVEVVPVKPAYTNGETVTLTAVAIAPNTFHGWSGATNSLSSTITLAMTTNLTVFAHLISLDLTWINGLTGDWFAATNWSPNFIPGTNDNLFINTGGTVTLNSDAIVGSVTFGNGNTPVLTGSGTLAFYRTFNWLGGDMRGSGRTLVLPGATMTIANPNIVNIFDRTLENAGTITWTGGFLGMGNGVITNRAGALFDVQSAGQINYQSTAARIDNAGTFRKSVDAGILFLSPNIAFNNYGTADIRIGTLQLGGGGLNNGIMTFPAGTALNLSGGLFASSAGSSITGAAPFTVSGGANLAGLVQLTGTNRFSNGTANLDNYICTNNVLIITASGTANFNGSSTVFPNILQLDGAVMGGTATVRIKTLLNWGGGCNMNDSGRTVIEPGAVANMAPVGIVNLNGRTLENAGTLVWTGDGYLGLGSAIITNRAGALFDAQGAVNVSRQFGNSRFDNAGTFRKSVSTATGGFDPGDSFNNYNTVEVLNGVLLMNGGYNSVSNAVLRAAIGGTSPGTGYGQLHVGGTVTLNGALNLVFANGFRPALNDSFAIVSTGTRNGAFSSFNYPSSEVTMELSNTVNSVLAVVTGVALPRPVLLPPQLSGSNLNLIWTATSNTTYRLEFNPNLISSNWNALPGDVTTLSNTASKLDALTPSNRFYRVRVLP